MDHAQEVPARAGGRNPEVPEKAQRRRFEAAYKLRIVEAADRVTEPGEVGELLRREGLYSSHWTNWRRQRDEGSLAGLEPKRCGRKAKRKEHQAQELAKLRRENPRLALRLRQAETSIDVPKKVSERLGIPRASPDEGESEGGTLPKPWGRRWVCNVPARRWGCLGRRGIVVVILAEIANRSGLVLRERSRVSSGTR